jgi:2-iminobutanoate/2-iminopropanoate deaminase
MKKIISTPKAPAAIGPYSQATEAGGMVFVSGQLPINAATGEMVEGAKAQTRQSLDNIRHILEAAGLTMDDVVKTTVLLEDISYFGEMNEVYTDYFTAGQCPARSAFAVDALPKGALVEIECIAARSK